MKRLLFLLPALLLAADPPAATKAAAKKNFKESGNFMAAVVVEAYTDYECPHCALFYKNFMPQFTADYIQTGKIKFVHRDFPLSMHPHAQLAARYANAAGELGYYDVVVKQIFDTQDDWGIGGKNTGNLDGAIAKVVPAADMQKIREMVKSDTKLDAGVQSDVNMAMNVDHVPSTPTLVFVSKGKRELFTNALETPYSIFKRYLDDKIAGK